MTTYSISGPDGKTYSIDGPPGATRDEVISRIKAQMGGSAPDAAPAPAPNAAVDAVRSIPGGLLNGAASFAGAPGNIAAVVTGKTALGGDIAPSIIPSFVPFIGGVPLPTIKGVIDAGSALFGGAYQPKTTAGNYAETIASFAPVALAPGGVITRAARVVLPGAASEAAGQAFEGTAAEPYARAAGALVGGLIPSIAGAGMRIANKAAEAATGTGFLNPNVEAARRLTKAFSADGGLGPAVDRSNSFTTSGASSPSVMDIGSGNVRRLVRAAAGGGDEAHNVATTYADRIRSNLQDNVTSRANRLTPSDQRTAAQAADDLETEQGRLATEQYREPYSQPATVTKEMVDALQGPEGRGAINRAYATARANRDKQQMAELSDLRDVAAAQEAGQNPITGRWQTLGQALSEVSAGSLDRVRIAVRDIARSYAAKNNPGMARGYFGRMSDIDTALDQTPGLQGARANYRQMQGSRDAVDVGGTILKAPSDSYAAKIADLASRGGPPNLRPLQVGARQAITDAVEAPAAGQTGVLTRLGTSNRATANLANTFGAERGAQFQEAVRNEVSRLRNANFISPETGSQTQLRLADEGLVGIPHSVASLVSKVADKIFRGTQLTAAEREAIVKLGTSEADIRRFANQSPSRAGRLAAPALELNASRANGQ